MKMCLVIGVVPLAGNERNIKRPSLYADHHGIVTASNADGVTMWRADTGTGQFVSLKAIPDGRFLLNGNMVLDSLGRLLERGLRVDDSNADEDLGVEHGWDELIVLTPSPGPGESYSAMGPLFDSNGNGWVFSLT